MKKMRSIVIGMIVIAVIMVAASAGLSGLQGRRGEEQRRSQRRAIERAAVLCYALEGAYPPDVDYLEKYGLILDEERFIIHYQTYGANIRPEIEVFFYD